ncbi:hypothetical protein DY000_02049078 [Brassica cretica]|uniref:Uncharacterized protein n=1 Tax=Brassica cretica TaxID=69181 RepID=A0ABQ7EWP4_BRACR|nr:hypothetical protein DY000_02049078 [Brassica cretica]
MAFSASSSPVSVSGRRWLFQHRERRLLFPGGGGSLSTASAGWFLESDDDVAVSRHIVDFGAEGKRKQGSRTARIERRLTC